MGSSSPAQSLSNEILAIIFAFLDSPAPSALRSRQQPNFQLTDCDVIPLKSISCVCKRWRPAALRILFCHTRLLLHYPFYGPKPSLNTKLKPFLGFVRRENFVPIIKSFVLGVGVVETSYRPADDPPHDIVSFWPTLFNVIDPITIIIVAPPAILGFLTCCTVDSRQHANFHMPYQILSLSQTSSSVDVHRQNISNTRPRYSPCHHYALFNLRPWSLLLLNEGSFLRAYSLPDAYQNWRTPPSILPALIGANSPHPRALIPSTVRTLCYIAIFPFQGHFALLKYKLPYLSTLYVQLIPINELASDYAQRRQVDIVYLKRELDSCYDELFSNIFQKIMPVRYRLLTEIEIGGATMDPSWSFAVEKRIQDAIISQRLDWRMEGKGIFRRELPPSASVSETDGNIDHGQGHTFPQTPIVRRHSVQEDTRISRSMAILDY